MEKELVCDLFEEAAPENESLARLLDDGRWQELISKFGKTRSPEQMKDFSDEKDVLELTQYEQPSAGQAENSADPLAALVQELIEGP